MATIDNHLPVERSQVMSTEVKKLRDEMKYIEVPGGESRQYCAAEHSKRSLIGLMHTGEQKPGEAKAVAEAANSR